MNREVMCWPTETLVTRCWSGAHRKEIIWSSKTAQFFPLFVGAVATPSEGHPYLTLCWGRRLSVGVHAACDGLRNRSLVVLLITMSILNLPMISVYRMQNWFHCQNIWTLYSHGIQSVKKNTMFIRWDDRSTLMNFWFYTILLHGCVMKCKSRRLTAAHRGYRAWPQVPSIGAYNPRY